MPVTSTGKNETTWVTIETWCHIPSNYLVTLRYKQISLKTKSPSSITSEVHPFTSPLCHYQLGNSERWLAKRQRQQQEAGGALAACHSVSKPRPWTTLRSFIRLPVYTAVVRKRCVGVLERSLNSPNKNARNEHRLTITWISCKIISTSCKSSVPWCFIAALAGLYSKVAWWADCMMGRTREKICVRDYTSSHFGKSVPENPLKPNSRTMCLCWKIN